MMVWGVLFGRPFGGGLLVRRGARRQHSSRRLNTIMKRLAMM